MAVQRVIWKLQHSAKFTLFKAPLLPETAVLKTVQAQDARRIYGRKFWPGEESYSEKLQSLALKSCSLDDLPKNSEQANLVAEIQCSSIWSGEIREAAAKARDSLPLWGGFSQVP